MDVHPLYVIWFQPVIFKVSGTLLLSHAVSSIVPSADRVLTVVFGMGTGVSPGRIGTGYSSTVHRAGKGSLVSAVLAQAVPQVTFHIGGTPTE